MTQTAQDLCHLARQQPLTPAGNNQAKDYYQQAISADPTYMPAYAELSYCYVRDYQNDWGGGARSASLDTARELADKAVDMANDKTNPWYDDFRGRWYRATVYWNDGEFARSFDEFEAARVLIGDTEWTSLNIADLDAELGEALVYYGEPNRAITLIEGAIARYPGHYWHKWNLGRAYYMARRYQDAIDIIGQITDPPDDCLLITAASQAQLGNISIAQSIMAAYSKNDPNWSIAKSAEYIYGAKSDLKHWTDGLRKAGLKDN